MLGIADDDDLSAPLGEAGDEFLDLLDDRTSGVDDFDAPLFQGSVDLRGHPVRADDDGPPADGLGILHGLDALFLQIRYDPGIVDNLAERQNPAGFAAPRALGDLQGPFYAVAESCILSHNDFHLFSAEKQCHIVSEGPWFVNPKYRKYLNLGDF